MMRQYELVERVRRYNPHADEDLLNRAYVFAMKAHGAQKRASGDPYFSHPLEVAAILTEFKLDDATIVAAMLHDTIEDTPVTRDETRQRVRRRDRRPRRRPDQAQQARLRLQARGCRPRTSASCCSPSPTTRACCWSSSPTACTTCAPCISCREAKRARIAQDTLDIYAPLAGRMGMQGLRSELEDLAFRYLMPEAHTLIVSRLEEMKTKNGALIARIADELKDQFARRGIKVRRAAAGRSRPIRSGARWSATRSPSSSSPTSTASASSSTRSPIATPRSASRTPPGRACMGRFKDYISTPKQNDYRSIHTTVIGPGIAARRIADPHPRDARDRRIRHRRARALQGRPQRASTPARAAPIAA